MNPFQQYELFLEGGITFNELFHLLKSASHYHYIEGKSIKDAVLWAFEDTLIIYFNIPQEYEDRIISLATHLLTDHWDEAQAFISSGGKAPDASASVVGPSGASASSPGQSESEFVVGDILHIFYNPRNLNNCILHIRAIIDNKVVVVQHSTGGYALKDLSFLQQLKKDGYLTK